MDDRKAEEHRVVRTGAEMKPSSPVVKLLSPAKLNLYLAVLGRRMDGFHDIETIMQPVSLCDEIEIAIGGLKDPVTTLSTTGISLDVADVGNLAYRAAEFFRIRTGIKDSFEIALHKNIPPGSGMGGGSSNAACVLRALNDAYGKPIDFETLCMTAEQLGSDVPFFLYNSPAICRGRGEIVEPLESFSSPFGWYVIAVPPIHVRTADVYAAWASGKRLPSPYADAASFLRAWSQNSEAPMFNALWASAKSVAPILSRYRSQLPTYSWTMTGSGSAFYAPVATQEDAIALRSKIPPVAGFRSFIVSSWPDFNGR